MDQNGKIKAKRWKVWRSAVKAKKAENKYNKRRKRKMAEPKAPVMESRTTQNVAGGVAVSAGSAIGAITFARSMFPDLMPWEAGQDQAVAAVAAGILIPFISRIIAKIRSKRNV